MAWIEKKQGKKGSRYLVRYREPLSHKTVSKSFRRAEDARSFKLDIERQIDRQEYTPQAERKVPLQSYVSSVIENDWETGESSKYSYRVRYEKWIKGSQFGQIPLGQVNTTQVRAFLDSVNNGPWSRRHIHKLLSKTFKRAVADGILQRNPMTGIKAPRADRAKKIEPLPVTVIEALASAAKDDMNRLAIHLAAYAGLRAGEVGGLRIQDVDEVHNRISIRQATARTGGKAVLGEPKTKGSRRTLEVPRFLIEEIGAFVASKGTTEDGRIFRTPKGGYLEHIRLNQECQEAAKRAGLPSVNFHSLRHTSVALLIRAGVHAKRISEFIGHSTISMTMDTYGHLFPSDEGEIAARMADLREEALTDAKVVLLQRGEQA